MRPSIVAPVYKSIMRAASDLIEQWNASHDSPKLYYQDWESRSDEAKLPKATLLGIDGFSFDENEGRWLISFALGLSSFKDANLLNEIEILDWLQREVGQGQKIKLYEMEAGEEISELVVTTFQILPMAQSELRNYRTIGIEMKRTENF